MFSHRRYGDANGNKRTTTTNGNDRRRTGDG